MYTRGIYVSLVQLLVLIQLCERGAGHFSPLENRELKIEVRDNQAQVESKTDDSVLKFELQSDEGLSLRLRFKLESSTVEQEFKFALVLSAVYEVKEDNLNTVSTQTVETLAERRIGLGGGRYTLEEQTSPNGPPVQVLTYSRDAFRAVYTFLSEDFVAGGRTVSAKTVKYDFHVDNYQYTRSDTRLVLQLTLVSSDSPQYQAGSGGEESYSLGTGGFYSFSSLANTPDGTSVPISRTSLTSGSSVVTDPAISEGDEDDYTTFITFSQQQPTLHWANQIGSTGRDASIFSGNNGPTTSKPPTGTSSQGASSSPQTLNILQPGSTDFYVAIGLVTILVIVTISLGVAIARIRRANKRTGMRTPAELESKTDGESGEVDAGTTDLKSTPWSRPHVVLLGYGHIHSGGMVYPTESSLSIAAVERFFETGDPSALMVKPLRETT